jgi:hypothetical protein
MNRRDFFLLGSRDRNVLELPCERLYMRYLDAQMEGTSEEFIQRTREELLCTRKIRLRDAFWLDRGDLGTALEPLLKEFRSRGGHIEQVG